MGIEIILRRDVEKVGLRGEVVNVARGYARNFLLPRGLAEEATPAKVAELRKIEERRARNEARTFEEGQKVSEQLAGLELRFDVKAGPSGSLFGSVTPTDIADEIWRTAKLRVDRRKIGIETIKRTGRYEVPIEVFQDVTAQVKTLVVPEGGELPPEEELRALAAAEADAMAPDDPEGESQAVPATEQLDELDAAAAAQDPVVSGETELEPTAADEAGERPDDEFDLAVDSAVEAEGEKL